MPTRILVLGSYLSSDHAGSAHATITLANALAGAAWAETWVFGYGIDRLALSPRLQGVIEGQPPGDLRFFWRFPSLFQVRRLAADLRRHPLPEVDVCYTRSTVQGLAYRQLFPDTFIISHTGFVLPGIEHSAETGREGLETRIETWLVDRLERKAYAAARWRHVVSTRLVASLREEHYHLPPGFFSICPLQIDDAGFDPRKPHDNLRSAAGIPDEVCLVITVARLVPLKNVGFLLRAVAGAQTKPWLVVLGDGPEESALRSLAAELGISERVRFVGRMTPAPWLAESDVFALPSRLESFGLVYAEAMSMGLPCLGLRNDPPRVLSSAGEVFQDGEGGFCVSTIDELRDRIDQLAGDPELRWVMGETAYRRAHTFFTGNHYLEFLRSVVVEPGSSQVSR